MRERNAALANVLKERQDEFDVSKTSTSQVEVTLGKLYEEVSVTARKLRFECVSAAVRHRELLAFICCDIKTRKE